ncbi:MAG: hydrogenase nickel incorporation protein HypB [Proteobacteria bacterium]|nr:hydrogenase nickel incorporation protein HypB [Pseudomonadota bacterium]
MEEVRLIEVKEDIMSDNAVKADELRAELKEQGTYLINLMSSPGAGKTTLILKTVEAIGGRIKVGVMEADIDSKVDAEKIAARGIEAVQLRTGGFCHLDANMVTKGLDAMNVSELDLIIIENVGNLVCPAEFDTGATKNIMILSVPEGDDKPLKYPLMFTVSDVMIIHKTDYLTLSDFNVELARERATSLNPNIKIFEISSRTGEGSQELADWLVEEVKAYQ